MAETRREPPSSVARADVALLLVRFAFLWAALIGLYFDLTQPSRYSMVTCLLSAAYAGYVVAVGQLRWRVGPRTPTHLFRMVTAAARETAVVGVACVLVLGAAALMLLNESRLDFERALVRVTVLAIITLGMGALTGWQRNTAIEVNRLVSAAERATLVRELHDGVLQSLLGIRLRLQALRQSVSSDRRLAMELQSAQKLLGHEIVRLRTLGFAMTPPAGPSRNLKLVLPELVSRFEHATGINARCVFTGNEIQVSPHVCHEIARILQEALVNVQKHSEANHVLVNVTRHEQGLRLVIEDDGRGVEEAAGGLSPGKRVSRSPRVIADRVRDLGGTVAMDGPSGAGTRLHIELPGYGS